VIEFLFAFFLGWVIGYGMGRFKRIGKFWELPGENYDD
jgi:hypothetical protein